MMKERLLEEYVQISDEQWQPFPTAFSEGGITWKLLHVSPEMGAWTGIFECPAGSSLAAHIHLGPGEYYLTKGRMDVRGGSAQGGTTAVAPGYGYETTSARHDKTEFPEDSAFFMTFLGSINFITPEGATIAVVGWQEVQHVWDAGKKQLQLA